MNLATNSQSGSLSVTINTIKKVALLHIEDGKNSMEYVLTSEETYNLAEALLKCYGKFSGYKSYLLTFSKESE